MSDDAYKPLDPEDTRLGSVDLFSVILEVHMWTTGASDTYLSFPGEELPEKYLKYLKNKLRDWRPSAYPFDLAVKNLVETTVMEAEREDADWLYRNELWRQRHAD